MWSTMLRYIKKLLGKKVVLEEIQNNHLDFSHIDSRQKAIEAVESGDLVAILAYPEILGGEDIELNTLYVPPAISDIHNQIVETLVRYVNQELIDNLQVKPVYKGKSFVPAEIKMLSHHSTKPGEFNPSIQIW